jgi:DNA polymerase V
LNHWNYYMLVQNVQMGPNVRGLENSIDESLVKNSTFMGIASGRSMEGMGIFDGDILIIDRAQDVKNYDIIVACLNGLFVCKIADLKNNQLLSSCPEYKPVKLTSFDEYCVEGVVTQSIRMHRPNARLG